MLIMIFKPVKCEVNEVGTYLNPSKNDFEEAINSEIYVDKTEMLYYLNKVVKTKKKYVSVSRPRRFGKTTTVDMLCAYYSCTSENRDLFENLKISGISPDTNKPEQTWDRYLGSFDVIRLVMTRFFKKNISVSESLSKLQCLVSREIKQAYPDKDYYNEADLIQTLDDAYSEKKKQIVIVIDEWDAVFRARPDDNEGQTEYLDFLRDLMKDNNNIALAYMTGILPIKKYGQHSALNMFTEYSMMFPRELARFTGFTEDEVSELCSSYGRDFENIRSWYDGYDVSDIIPPDPGHSELKATGKSPEAKRYSLYSPLSVVEAVTTGVIKNYWNKTETYEALAEYIRKDYDGLKDAVALLMDGGRVEIDTSTYQNDMTTFSGRDDILSLLVHLGYLGFDDVKSEVFIPNREILDEFRTSTKSSEWITTFESFRISQELLKATWESDEIRVAELLEKAHNRTESKTYNSEAALSYAIQYAYYAAQKYYTTIQELATGKGYADIIYLPSPKYPDKPALLIELKYNKDAVTAVEQIKNKQYPEKLEHYKGNILVVGINYDKDAPSDSPDFKHHSCKIERA